jgi:hypothetical protein
VSLKIKPISRSLLPIAAGTALVLITSVTPMATLAATAAGLRAGVAAQAWLLSSMSVGLAAGLLAAGVIGDNVVLAAGKPARTTSLARATNGM